MLQSGHTKEIAMGQDGNRTIESWVEDREALIQEMIAKKDEIAKWARRILEAIEKARLEGMFDPNGYPNDIDTGPRPTHAEDWYAIRDAIDLASWADAGFLTGTPEGMDIWKDAVKLARDAWEDEAQARGRNTNPFVGAEES